jgi:hypothetical protein
MLGLADHRKCHRAFRGYPNRYTVKAFQKIGERTGNATLGVTGLFEAIPVNSSILIAHFN